jgi:hypothetical protein
LFQHLLIKLVEPCRNIADFLRLSPHVTEINFFIPHLWKPLEDLNHKAI